MGWGGEGWGDAVEGGYLRSGYRLEDLKDLGACKGGWGEGGGVAATGFYGGEGVRSDTDCTREEE